MMRFCNESANIGNFCELPTKGFKNIPFSISLLGRGNVYTHFRSNIPVSDDRIL
jgi:hypothetical protein